MVKALWIAHGGLATVANQSAGGAVFTVELPGATPEPGPSPVKPDRPIPVFAPTAA